MMKVRARTSATGGARARRPAGRRPPGFADRRHWRDPDHPRLALFRHRSAPGLRPARTRRRLPGPGSCDTERCPAPGPGLAPGPALAPGPGRIQQPAPGRRTRMALRRPDPDLDGGCPDKRVPVHGPPVSPPDPGAVQRRHARRLRLRADGGGPVPLSGRSAGLSRPRRLPRAFTHGCPRRCRPCLRDRPRDRPARATSSRSGSSFRPTASPASGPTSPTAPATSCGRATSRLACGRRPPSLTTRCSMPRAARCSPTASPTPAPPCASPGSALAPPAARDPPVRHIQGSVTRHRRGTPA